MGISPRPSAALEEKKKKPALSQTAFPNAVTQHKHEDTSRWSWFLFYSLFFFFNVLFVFN